MDQQLIYIFGAIGLELAGIITLGFKTYFRQRGEIRENKAFREKLGESMTAHMAETHRTTGMVEEIHDDVEAMRETMENNTSRLDKVEEIVSEYGIKFEEIHIRITSIESKL